MILFFSGTGNTRFLASQLAEKLASKDYAGVDDPSSFDILSD